MFFTCWAKLFKNESIDSVIPSFTKSIPRPHGSPIFSEKFYVNQTPRGKSPQNENPSLTSRIYYLNAKSIEKIQPCTNEHGKKYNKIEAFCAYLWNLPAHLDSHVDCVHASHSLSATLYWIPLQWHSPFVECGSGSIKCCSRKGLWHGAEQWRCSQ